MPGHGDLVQFSGPGDVRHLLQHPAAGIILHQRIDPGGVPAQLGIHLRKRFEAALPVQAIDQTQGVHQVVQPHQPARPGVVGLTYQLVGAETGFPKPRFQSLADIGQPLLVASAHGVLDEIGGEPFKFGAGTAQPFLSPETFRSAFDDALADAGQPLRSGHAQGDGRRPQLAKGQRSLVEECRQPLLRQWYFTVPEDLLRECGQPHPSATGGQAVGALRGQDGLDQPRVRDDPPEAVPGVDAHALQSAGPLQGAAQPPKGGFGERQTP